MGCGASSHKGEKGDVVCSRADRTRTGRVQDDDGNVGHDMMRVRWDDTGDVSDWLGSPDEEKKERETTGQALVEGGKLPEIMSILTRPDVQDFINYIHEGKESARCIYAASSVWWAARHGHLKTLEALIAAGADVSLAPRLLHDVVPASVRIAGAVGEKAARLNGVYDAVIDVDSYVQLSGKPALRKRNDPDTWLFFVRGSWAIATADKEANDKSCLCQGWHSAMAKFDEETGATCLRQHVMVAGVVGRKADQLNGVYEPMGDLVQWQTALPEAE